MNSYFYLLETNRKMYCSNGEFIHNMNMEIFHHYRWKWMLSSDLSNWDKRDLDEAECTLCSVYDIHLEELYVTN